jgi:thiol-disulfide isomerase/thioredoxin
MRSALLFFSACVVAAAAGFGFYHYRSANRPPADQPMPAGLQLDGLDGHPHKFEEWRGKLLLINFWATWCTVCMDEIPELVKLQREYGAQGLQIVGPAVDDPDTVRSMIGRLGINYPVLTSSPDAMIGLMEQLGNGPGGVPFSVVVSADGHIVQRQIGEFTVHQLGELIATYLPPSPAHAQ